MKYKKYIQRIVGLLIVAQLSGCSGDDNNGKNTSVNGVWKGDINYYDGSILFSRNLRSLFLRKKFVSIIDVCASDCGLKRPLLFITGSYYTSDRKVVVKEIKNYDQDGIEDSHIFYVDKLKGKVKNKEDSSKNIMFSLLGNRLDPYYSALNYIDIYQKIEVDVKTFFPGTYIYKKYRYTGNSSSPHEVIYTNTVTFEDSGLFWGQDSDDCVMSGEIDWLNGKNNIYNAALKVESCGNVNGNYEGLATTVGSYAAMELVAYNENRLMHFEFNSPEYWTQLEASYLSQ